MQMDMNRIMSLLKSQNLIKKKREKASAIHLTQSCMHFSELIHQTKHVQKYQSFIRKDRKV